MFGTSFAFAMAGVHAKDKILTDAKKVGDVLRKNEKNIEQQRAKHLMNPRRPVRTEARNMKPGEVGAARRAAQDRGRDFSKEECKRDNFESEKFSFDIKTGKSANYGDPNSTRPDGWKDPGHGEIRTALENKSCNLLDSARRRQTIDEVAQQAKDRVKIPNCRQEVHFDAIFQNISKKLRDEIKQELVRKTDGILSPEDIKFRMPNGELN
jgi:hypothetical protein